MRPSFLFFNGLFMFRYITVLALIVLSGNVHADLIFFEDVGTTATSTGQSIASYSGFTSGLTFEGNIAEATVITPSSQQSSGYLGASGSSQFALLQSNSQSTDLIIRGIDTTSFQPNSFDLSFGLRKSLSAGFSSPLVILATTNDVDFSQVDQPVTSFNADWQQYTGIGLDLPSSTNLSLYISKSPGFTAPIDVFIDDIRLAAVTAVPEPSSFALASMGAAAMVFVGRRRRRTKG